MELAQDKRFQLIGINYKDKPENAAAFLTELGNPFAKIGSDVSGRAGIDWGVYGVPETYVIGPGRRDPLQTCRAAGYGEREDAG